KPDEHNAPHPARERTSAAGLTVASAARPYGPVADWPHSLRGCFSFGFLRPKPSARDAGRRLSSFTLIRFRMFALLPYASALLAVVRACLHAARRRSISDAALAAGLVVLATDSVFLSFCQQVSAPQDVAEWAIRRLLVLAAMPGVWLLFSTTYARGSSGWRRRSQGNRASLLASIFGPVALALIAQPGLITALQQTTDGARLLTLGLTGVLLQVWILVGGVLVLMNLERTF